jgi:hypothetical protein
MRAPLTSFHWEGNWVTGMSHINFIGSHKGGEGGERPAEGTKFKVLQNCFSVESFNEISV